MNHIQASRLLTLAQFLQTEVKSKNFDMHWYASIRNQNNLPPNYIHNMHPKAACGTTACAIGWCSAIWPDRFELRFSEDRAIFLLYFDKRLCGYDQQPVKDFFGLANFSDAAHLFSSSQKRTPQEEADVIKLYVAESGWTSGKILAHIANEANKTVPAPDEPARYAAYRVTVTRDITESTSVTVAARTAKEANEKALLVAQLADDWEVDENTPAEPYLPDPDSTERLP